ncbi:putative holin-like toxin [Paenibacillus lautus]
MEVKDVLTLMIQFGSLLVALVGLVGLVVTIVLALNQNKKK